MFDFGSALRLLKDGLRVSRAGWTQPSRFGLWICLQEGYPDGIAINGNTARATGLAEGTVCTFSPYLMMHTGFDNFAPWFATQADLLAEDWYPVVNLAAPYSLTSTNKEN